MIFESDIHVSFFIFVSEVKPSIDILCAYEYEQRIQTIERS